MSDEKRDGGPAGPSEPVSIFSEPSAWHEKFERLRKDFDQLVADQNEKLRDIRAHYAKERAEIEHAFREVSPLSNSEASMVPRRRAAYSDRMSALLAKLSMFAYIKFEDPSYRPVLAALLERGGLTLVETININEVEAFVARADHFMVVAFRGTSSPDDEKIDMRVGVRRIEVDAKGKHIGVHSGFYHYFKTVSSAILDALNRDEENRNKSVYLTGHSLGGALALIASAEFAASDQLGDRISAVYTFGAPRVGNERFPDTVKAPHYRVVNDGDIVPMVPPSWLWGYRHTGEAKLIKRNQSKLLKRRPAGAIVPLVAWSLLRWMFGGKNLVMIDRHRIDAYTAELERIARVRGGWS